MVEDKGSGRINLDGAGGGGGLEGCQVECVGQGAGVMVEVTGFKDHELSPDWCWCGQREGQELDEEPQRAAKCPSADAFGDFDTFQLQRCWEFKSNGWGK